MKRQVYLGRAFYLLFIVFLFIPSNKAKSQIENFNGLPQFLFPEFSTSRVKLKAGKDLNLLLNYNLVTEKMVFFQKNQVFDMVNQGAVDTIYLSGSKFIPNDKAFYEAHSGVPVSLFIQHRGRLLAPPKPAAYGGTSEVSSSTYITRMEFGSQVYNMKLEADLRVKYDPMYWVRFNDQMYSFVNEKQYLKIFTGKEDVLKQYIKKNRLRFEKPNDLLKIWAYTNAVVK
jgi:hypothetical protein